MIKDVKNYFQTVATRLSNAFAVDHFDVEQELEFWSLAAEHFSREDPPVFRGIVHWIDLLYHAPAHFVYISDSDNKLKLFRRQVISENLKEIVANVESEKDKNLSNKLLQDFEERINNLEKKLTKKKEFEVQGTLNFTIGRCQYIPLFKDEDFWGIYCVGPYVETPEKIAPRLSIVGRILSEWLVEIFERENEPRHKIKAEFEHELGELGTGTLNVESISKLLLNNLSQRLDIPAMAFIDRDENGIVPISLINLPANFIESINERNNNGFSGEIVQQVFEANKAKESYEGLKSVKMQSIFDDRSLPALCIFSNKDTFSKELDSDEYFKLVLSTIRDLIIFRDRNVDFSELLLDTYLKMLREKEMSRDKTYYHTSRIVAFCRRFASEFGLNERETKILLKTARLHDIGYIGIAHFQEKRTIGTDIQHPMIGELMVKALPLEEEVKKGIATHHEWVDGSGTPKGVKAEEIPWTGKIVGMVEFIVQFIESNQIKDSHTDEEWIEKLTEELVKRADRQFDMVLIPTVTGMVSELGWDGCCKLGTE